MAWTLRVTDEMIDKWADPMGGSCCPLTQALEVELRARGTEPTYMINASYIKGGAITYQVGSYWYIIYPVPQDTQPALAFMHKVDELQGADPNKPSSRPRKRLYRYGNPQSHKPGWN